MIKVLQFPIANSKGGITQYILTNWKFIDKSRFQFDFATMSKSLTFAESLEKEGCKIHYISCYAEDDKDKFVDEFREILVKGNYDVVHLHTSYWKSFYVEQIAKEVGVKKIIIHAHTTGVTILDDKQRNDAIQVHKENLNLLTEEMATDYWACTWKAADFLFGNRISKKNIRIMKNVIDLSQFKYNKAIRQKYRSKMGLDRKYVIGNVGLFVYPKNQGFLLEVFSEICKSHKNSSNEYRLLLVGAGAREQEYKNMVQNLDIKNEVIFTGYRSDISELLQAMDLFCLPSIMEGMPIALIEAQAAGLPCVVSDQITHEAIINDDVDSLPLDVKAWKEKILEYSVKKNNRESLINKEYDIRTQIKCVERGYLE